MQETSLPLASFAVASRLARVSAGLGAWLVAASVVACSSSSSSPGTTPSNDAGQTGSDSGMTGSDSSTPGDSGSPGNPGTDSGNPGGDSGMATDSGGPGDGGGGDAAVCEQNCIDNNMAAYTKFAGYELQSCACASGSVCASMCTAECMNPSTLSMNSPCGVCLTNEAGKGTASTCTVSAGLMCIGDSTCSAFVTCEQACM